MRILFWVLCAEGSTDAMLVPIVRWALAQRLGRLAPADGELSTAGGSLAGSIAVALRDYEGVDLLVVHRDADQPDHTARAAEIEAALAASTAAGAVLPAHLIVVPAVESEAWLLFDEAAIRRAAANPRGKARLGLPPRHHDRIADPKSVLNAALDAASEYTGRKLRNFQRDRRPVDVANEITDFTPLRQFDAFCAFEADVAAFAARWRADCDAGAGA